MKSPICVLVIAFCFFCNEKKQFMLRELLKDALKNFVAAAVILGCATALAKFEMWLESEHYPSGFLLITKIIIYFLYILDGVVVCGTATIVAVKLLLNMISANKEDED
jgi:hypothetical protein